MRSVKVRRSRNHCDAEVGGHSKKRRGYLCTAESRGPELDWVYVILSGHFLQTAADSPVYMALFSDMQLLSGGVQSIGRPNVLFPEVDLRGALDPKANRAACIHHHLTFFALNGKFANAGRNINKIAQRKSTANSITRHVDELASPRLQLRFDRSLGRIQCGLAEIDWRCRGIWQLGIADPAYSSGLMQALSGATPRPEDGEVKWNYHPNRCNGSLPAQRANVEMM